MSELNGSVLVVDDDPALGKVVLALLAQGGLSAHHVPSAERALEFLAARPVDVVVTDVRMTGMTGIELLAEVVRRYPGVAVIVITAHGTIPLAVEAMKAGASDFVLKPFDREELLFAVRKALTSARHPSAEETAGLAGGMVGESPAMKEVQALIRKAAASSATVLLRGETGTGKELAARAIHEQSARRAGPLVRLHCGALPDSLLESELFGYEKGAFTGAATRKPGRVELANGGTLFLDEIGDVTPAVQVKLLRLLQEREFERLGGTETQRVDVRFVAATHRNLEELIKEGKFREDLFYRLNVVPIWLPALRQRREDIGPLALHFVEQLGQAHGRPTLALSPEAIAFLEQQAWPGNVRQLQNFLERVVVLCDGPRLDRGDLERELDRHLLGTGTSASRPEPPAAPAEGTLDDRRKDVERQALEEALRRAGNNRTLAARLLGVSRRTLYNKLQEHGLS